jgi:hypothetical protein
MTEIAPYSPPQQNIALTDPTGGRLVAWAEAAGAAHQLALSLCQTSFVPKDFAGKPGDATAAILMGDELGLSPIASLRSIYVVHGTPALYAKSMVALAQSHGHEVWTEKSTAAEVVVCGQRRGSSHVERSSWTIARATKAKYTTNAKYASNPEEMLYSKAAAEIARKVAADVLAGVPYSVEDLELDQPQPTSSVSRDDAPKTSVKRAAAPEPEEPSFDGPPAAEPEQPAEPVESAPRPASRDQVVKLNIQIQELGITGREEKLDYISTMVQRPIKSSNDLTMAEASKLIDAMENPEAAAQ